MENKPPLKETNKEKSQCHTVEAISKNITSLARSVEALLGGPLNRKALVLLLANSTGMTQGAVNNVLETPSKSCWTLVIVGKSTREWGFWHQGKFYGWRAYVDGQDGQDGIADQMKACD